MSKMRPRTLCLQHRFGTDSALSWWTLAGKPCTLIDQSMPQWSHSPWRVAEYQPYRRWTFSEWFWWPRNTSKTRRWHTRSTSFKRLDSPGASFGCKSSLGTGTIHSVATSPSTVSASSISIGDGSLASASRGRRIHRGPVEYGHGNRWDWCVIAKSNTTSEPESVNHQQDKSSNARFNGKKKDEPVLTASPCFKGTPI